MRESEAMKASYFWASFLMSFLFLFNFCFGENVVSFGSMWLLKPWKTAMMEHGCGCEGEGNAVWIRKLSYLQVISAHGINTVMLGPVDIVLVTENAD